MIGSEFCLSYSERTAAAALPVDQPHEIDVCKHLCLDSVKGLRLGCLPGDSSSGVFARGENGLDFVGLLVSIYLEDVEMMEPSPRCGLVVPAGRVFAQIQGETGREWDISGETLIGAVEKRKTGGCM